MHALFCSQRTEIAPCKIKKRIALLAAAAPRATFSPHDTLVTPRAARRGRRRSRSRDRRRSRSRSRDRRRRRRSRSRERRCAPRASRGVCGISAVAVATKLSLAAAVAVAVATAAGAEISALAVAAAAAAAATGGAAEQTIRTHEPSESSFVFETGGAFQIVSIGQHYNNTRYLFQVT